MPQYNGVWTLEAQAQAQSNQQWVTDPDFKNTTLLLQADGTGSGSQNNTFLDSSTNNVFINRLGNPTQGSFSPFSQAPGYWGNYFNGSSWISVPDSTDLDLASGTSWTIEAWVYNTGSSGIQNIMGSQNSAGDVNFLIGIGASNELKVVWSNSTPTAYTVSAPSAVIRNTWIHVAAVNNAGTLSLYVNGVSVGTPLSISGTFRNLASVVSIGRSGDYASQYWVGYISNARIVNGTALYTSNFTPSTTPFTDVTNTKLLTCQSNRFVDTNTQATAKTITIGGTPSVQAFGPFAPALQWTPDVVGGSGYFDGTVDYLTGTITAVNNTTMTMECWVYNTALDNTNGNHYIMVNNSTNANYALTHDGTGKARYVSRNNSGGAIFDLISATNVLKLNQWQHVVGVRNASAASLYVDGVRVATVASPTVSTTDGTTLYISSNGGTGRIISGYLASTRIVSGTAIYDPTLTTCPVPTAPLTAVTNTRLLLNFNNAGIYDGKMANVLETVADAQVSTSVVKYGSGSIKFDGTGDCLYSAAPNVIIDTNFGSGNFTIESWVFLNSTPTSENGLMCAGPTTSGSLNRGWGIEFHNGVSTGIWFYQAGVITTWTNLGPIPPINTWTHIAIVRNNTVVTCYVNGVATGTASAGTNTQTAFSAGDPLFIGAFYSSATAGRFFYNGYMDDVRITKSARYTANFTPPQQALPRQ